MGLFDVLPLLQNTNPLTSNLYALPIASLMIKSSIRPHQHADDM